MTVRQQWGVVLAVVAVLAGGLLAATRALGDEIFPLGVGSVAPEFNANTLEPTPRAKTLADYRGQVVLLNLWATWCPPCREEMPSIQALHESYGAAGLRVVAVSVDGAGEEQKIRDFVRAYGLTFEVLHDPAGAIRDAYQTTGVPETFVVGPDGVIRKKAFATDWNSPANRALIGSLLAARAAQAVATGGAL